MREEGGGGEGGRWRKDYVSVERKRREGALYRREGGGEGGRGGRRFPLRGVDLF